MATAKRTKVVQTVFRDRSPASATFPATVVGKGIGKAPASAAAKPNTAASKLPKVTNNTAKAAPSAKVAKARVSRTAQVAPLRKKKAVNVVKPKAQAKEVAPHVLKSTAGKPLEERLNPKLLEQLRTRKVTNAQAADALGVSETYLSRTVAAIQEKDAGVTTEHRKARSKLAKARSGTRAELAKKVNRGELTLAQACKQANCSERTMYRWCEKYANVKKAA